MKIEEVKKLDDGVSNIIIEGEIIKTPLKPREGQYGWSQLVILKDDTDEISSWINIEGVNDDYKIGQYIEVKGKVSKYTKGGKPGVSLNGNVIDEIVKDETVSQEKPNDQPKAQPKDQPNQEQEKDMEEVWEAKDLRRVKECISKNATALVIQGIITLKDRFKYMNEEVDFFYGNNIRQQITSEAITKELGGTAKEEGKVVEYDPEIEGDKEQKIAQAKEIVGQIELASEPQLKMVEKIVKSKYITPKELKNIGDLKVLTNQNASKYISYWFGDGEKIGERAERELIDKNDNPFVTEREKMEKVDESDKSSLLKDVLIDKIQAKRKELCLEDDAKFTEKLGYNTNFDSWTEKELTKLMDLLRNWKPKWVTEK